MTFDDITNGDPCPYCKEIPIFFYGEYFVQCPGCQANLCDADYQDPAVKDDLCLCDADAYADIVSLED